MVEQVNQRTITVGRLLPIAAIVGVLGAALWGLGLVATPTRAMFAYLIAYMYVLSFALGALLLAMIGRTMGARWVLAIRRLEESIFAALPMLALLFVPVLLGAEHLYEWLHVPEAGSGAHVDEHHLHLIDKKRPYLQLPFFVVRAIIYFGSWILMAELLRRWSLRRDAGHDVPPGREKAFSAAMLPLMGLCITFAAFDWVMSLMPTWFSSIFGVYYFSASILGGLALITLLAQSARRRGLLPELSEWHNHALGRLLFGFTIFWAYIAFFQALLINMADKPEEAVFYTTRLTGSWEWITYILLLGHFVIPFFALLPRPVKKHPGMLTALSLWILVFHYLDMYWLILPAYAPGGADLHWVDPAALAAVGGIAAAFAAWRARTVPILPWRHPDLAAGLAYRSKV